MADSQLVTEGNRVIISSERRWTSVTRHHAQPHPPTRYFLPILGLMTFSQKHTKKSIKMEQKIKPRALIATATTRNDQGFVWTDCMTISHSFYLFKYLSRTELWSPRVYKVLCHGECADRTKGRRNESQIEKYRYSVQKYRYVRVKYKNIAIFIKIISSFCLCLDQKGRKIGG